MALNLHGEEPEDEIVDHPTKQGIALIQPSLAKGYPFLFFMLRTKRKSDIGRSSTHARVTQSDITLRKMSEHQAMIEITW